MGAENTKKNVFVYYIFFGATIQGYEKEGGVVIELPAIIDSQETIDAIQLNISTELRASSVLIKNVVLLSKKTVLV